MKLVLVRLEQLVDPGFGVDDPTFYVASIVNRLAKDDRLQDATLRSAGARVHR